jgi:ankyrin repeat protein
MSDLLAMLDAVNTGDVGRVRQISESNPDLASARLPTGESPLMAALYRGHHDVVRALIDAGADIDVFAAAALGRTEELNSALADPASVRSHAYDGWTPLHLAAFFGHVDAARLLIGAGADIGAVSRNSLANTPLHAATAGKHEDVALALLDHGANGHIVDAGGYTPLQIATQNGLAGVVERISRPS